MPYEQLSGAFAEFAAYSKRCQSLFPDVSKFFALLAIDLASET